MRSLKNYHFCRAHQSHIDVLYKNDYITEAFPRLLEKYGLRRIRFHDLRHTSASLLLANGVQLKDIQTWLGHNDFSTTANTYAHLDANSKQLSLEALSGAVLLQ